MRRFLVLAYGVVCYAMFLGVFLYAVGFMVNAVVPKSIDSPREGSLAAALLVNVGLLALFGVQHSVMARPTFKNWWTKYVPTEIERSTYVLFSNLALIALFAFWRPLGGVIWDVSDPTLRLVCHGVGAAGWLTVLVTTFLINHFDLFGLRQVWLYFRGVPYTSLGFVTPGPYRLVRHPLYVGWILAFWGTPTMTAAHLLFAVGTTLYILVAIRLEERNLEEHYGETYAAYRKRVPMLVPGIGRKPMKPQAELEPAAA